MSFDIFRRKSEIDTNKYFIVKYDLQSNIDVKKGAWDLAIGQSVGNPNVRNHWETDDLFENHSCIVLLDDNGHLFTPVEIGFPVINTDWENDGISHLICQIMGGQTDIDHITKCRALDIELPETVTKHFDGPKFGLKGFRKFTGVYDKPLLGGIIKPKTGMSPQKLLGMVKELVEGGVNFIKEDEILSNPVFCSLEDRTELIANYINNCGKNVVYCFCINGDPHTVEKRAKFVSENGGNGVHINLWSGLGVYHTIRRLDLPLFIHFQKSGDKVITHENNAFGISWKLICKLAALMGVDTIHSGMWGGYLSNNEEELKEVLNVLRVGNVTPALSCGMHPGLVDAITDKFGFDYMANVGGALHGHPGGTIAGTKAMRQAIDKNYSTEYEVAIQKWGKL